MREAVIDTNVLVYDTFSDALYHKQAALLLDSLDAWVIPLIVIYEYAWFLKGFSIEAEITREKVLDYVEDERAVVTCEGLDAIRWALNMLVEEKVSVARFNDKVVLSVAARKGLPLATFDVKLRKQAERIGIEVLPEEVRVG